MSDEIRETLRAELESARAVAGDSGPANSEPSSPDAVVDGDGGAPAADVSAAGNAGTSSASDGQARDASGKFTKAEETPKPKEGEKKATPAPLKAEPSKTPAPIPGDTTQTPQPKYRAPQSWKPALREKWGALGEELQAEIDRREREIAKELSSTAEPRKFYDQFRQTIAPYEGLIRAQGAEPMQAVSSLLQFGAGMISGTPQNKAMLIANVIKTYGVDLATLDSILAGQAPAQGQPQQFDPNQFAQQVEQRILSGLQQRQAQAMSQRSAQEAEAFATDKEFFEDIRGEVADVLESSARRGVAMTLEQAYKKALSWHKADDESEIGKVLRQREAAQRANASNASTQRAQAAASSVKSHPAPNGVHTGDSIRETLRHELAESRRR